MIAIDGFSKTVPSGWVCATGGILLSFLPVFANLCLVRVIGRASSQVCGAGAVLAQLLFFGNNGADLPFNPRVFLFNGCFLLVYKA
jgi:hypothetical protein